MPAEYSASISFITKQRLACQCFLNRMVNVFSMVRPEGIEPTTHGLGNHRSILLSYGRINNGYVLSYHVLNMLSRNKYRHT